MADEDEDRSNRTPDDDELASKLARLTEEQQARYQREVQNTIDRNVEASEEYRLKLADTLLKDMPDREKNLEIRDLNSRQDQLAYWRDHERDRADRPMPATAPDREPPNHEPNVPNPSSTAQPNRENSLEGKQPRSPSHDYSELQRTHQQAADLLKQAERPPAATMAPEQSAKHETAMLSKESLAIMLEHFPEIRREAGLPTTQSEINERAALTHMQDSNRQKLEQAHAQAPSPQPDKQHAERNLLDHQHLAEQVGVQAKWIAEHLKAQSPAEAGKYKADSRRALQTAHFIYEQRQHSGAAKDRSQETARDIEPDHPQKQAHSQESVHEGKELTSEQRANPSPEARQIIEREERVAAAREVGVKGKDQNAQPGNTRTGKSPSGGRSR